MDDAERYEMLYCDNALCRVNTFERGPLLSIPSVEQAGPGYCPGCLTRGEQIPVKDGQ